MTEPRGDDTPWVEALHVPGGSWVPQGTIIITSGQKLQLPNRKAPND